MTSPPIPPLPPIPPSPSNANNAASGGSPGDPFSLQLEAYLDGQLGPQEQAAFEALAAARKFPLNEQVKLQREIDLSMARLFAYEAPNNLELPAPAPLPIAKHVRTQRLRLGAVLALAASLLLACIYIYWPRQEIRIGPVQSTYARLERTGWNPDFTCKTDEEFAQKVKERLGTAMVIPMSTLGVVLDGWGYAQDYDGGPLSKSTMYLLTHVDGKRVLVLIDKKKNDRELYLPPNSTLTLHRKEIGDLILYEVTPWTQSKAIDAAILP